MQFAVKDSLGNLACIQAKALGEGAFEETLRFVNDANLSSDAASFALAEAQAKARGFQRQHGEIRQKIADDWTQSRLFYLMAAALAEYGKLYDERIATLSQAGDEWGKRFKDALGDQLLPRPRCCRSKTCRFRSGTRCCRTVEETPRPTG